MKQIETIRLKSGRVRRRVYTINEAPSKTSQEFKAECDVNVIMAKYGRTGVFPSKRTGGMYGDFTKFSDLQAASEIVQNAAEAFQALPAKIRKRFNNDPTKLVEFLSDASNRAEAESLGLIVPREEQRSSRQAAEENAHAEAPAPDEKKAPK